LKEPLKRSLYSEYKIFLAINLIFVVAALFFDTPADIIRGMGEIFASRGLLLTDYMVIGGVGAALVNMAMVGFYAVGVLYVMGAKPTGAALMCLWMSTGWASWGAHVFSILPFTIGVWLFSKYKKKPFSDYMVGAVLCHAIAPIVSVFYVSNPIMLHLGAEWHLMVNILFGLGVGMFIGFFLPAILGVALRMHDGFTLYNMGVAGGFIAMFLAAILSFFRIQVPTEFTWYYDHQLEITIFLVVISAALILAGILTNRKNNANHFEGMKKLIALTGHKDNDFYTQLGGAAYINMGLLCLIGTIVTLAVGAELNGATFACIFSMVAFGSFGKHIHNVLPIITGGILGAIVSVNPIYAPSNILPILFATCLAPIAGKYGWFWGIVTGYIHLNIISHVGHLTNGFVLYNNGFASGFVAMMLVPLIIALQRKLKAE